MSRLVLASFYTPEYAEEAAGLTESIAALALDGVMVRIEPRESRGRWELNCARKPEYLCGLMMDLADGDRIVWIDADARLDQDPTGYFRAIPDAVDFGVHWRAGDELLSGTIYLRVGDGARLLTDMWRSACGVMPSAWDQRVLQKILHRIPNLVSTVLPPALCCIPDLMPGVHAVIRHRQASRRLKMEVGP